MTTKLQQIITRIPFPLYERLLDIQFKAFQSTQKRQPLKYFINEALSQYVEKKPYHQKGRSI